METLLIIWSILLSLWTLYLMLSSIALHKRHTALRIEQYKWFERVTRMEREKYD
jgi:hypothetical protein